ncbi:MAG: S8 family serine peptidase, partial [Muribaculaceae bacterium]|nr:S8 family serine peptidase [Muribaculaceae bacterium]
MKSKIRTTALILILSGAMISTDISEARSKLSLRDRQTIDLMYRDIREGRITRSEVSQKVVMFITVLPNVTAEEIAMPGITIVDQIGDAFIVELPIDSVDEFLKNNFIKAAAFDRCDSPDMFYARREGNANINNAQTDPFNELGHAYLGKDVICGVFDIGFDVNHVDFLDNADRSKTRVKKLVVFKGSSSSPEIDTEDGHEILSFTTDKNDAKHGTHVLGIMAGGYLGPGEWNDVDFGPDSLKFGLVSGTLPGQNPDGTRPVPFYGVAPKADIAICGNRDGLYGGAQIVGAR